MIQRRNLFSKKFPKIANSIYFVTVCNMFWCYSLPSLLSFFKKSHPCFCIYFYEQDKLIQIYILWLKYSNNEARKELFVKRNLWVKWEKNNNDKFLFFIISGLPNKQQQKKTNQSCKTTLFYYFYLNSHQQHRNSFSNEKRNIL